MYAYRFHIVYLATVLCCAMQERILTVSWIGYGYVLVSVHFHSISWKNIGVPWCTYG